MESVPLRIYADMGGSQKIILWFLESLFFCFLVDKIQLVSYTHWWYLIKISIAYLLSPGSRESRKFSLVNRPECRNHKSRTFTILRNWATDLLWNLTYNWRSRHHQWQLMGEEYKQCRGHDDVGTTQEELFAGGWRKIETGQGKNHDYWKT